MRKKIERNELCWCGSNVKYKKCHMLFDEKINDYIAKGYIVPSRKIIKNSEQIMGIRESGKVNIAVLDCVAEKIRAGITTLELDSLIYKTTTKLGGIPADLGYEGYPKSVCISINNEVCHGIPSDKVIIKDGDIVNVDVSTLYKEYFSDSSRMFCIGNVSEENKKLVQVTKECVEMGLMQVKPWRCLGDMSQAVHEHALKHGYSIVKEIGGHGVGLKFHEDPFVSYVAEGGTGMLMVPGMIFTIEPMVNMGTDRIKEDKKNGWTIYTADGAPSAQWEVTVLVTEDGSEVLAY
jgi:methionyl aminopeptidase